MKAYVSLHSRATVVAALTINRKNRRNKANNEASIQAREGNQRTPVNKLNQIRQSDHSINQEIFHYSNVDGKAGDKPATMVDASGQNGTNQKP